MHFSIFVSAIVSLDSPIKIIKTERIIRGFKINNKKLITKKNLEKKFEINEIKDHELKKNLQTLVKAYNEKKIRLTLSIEENLNNLSSSNKHSEVFKRTISRMFEMTKGP